MINRLHPVTIFLYFVAVISTVMFTDNIFFEALALFISLTMLLCWMDVREILRKIPSFLLLFILISIINPLFYHNGDTVLFYINGLRITKEALIYGIKSGIMIISVLTWCISLSHYMTSDKTLALFGFISPKLALVISMSIRFIPSYIETHKKMKAVQKLRGLYGDNTLIERIKAEGKLFSGMLTYSLEHSMTTSDSMCARGYGISPHKSYIPFTFKKTDAILSVLIFTMTVLTFVCIFMGYMKVIYYPHFEIIIPSTTEQTLKALGGFILYAATALSLPIYELHGNIRNYFTHKENTKQLV